MTSFGEQLIAARKAKGYTQEQLAEKLLVSRTTISRWESGKIMPDIDTIKLLSKELDFNFFTVDDILTETSASADTPPDDNAPSPAPEPAPEAEPSPAPTAGETVQAIDSSDAVQTDNKPAAVRLHPALKNKKLWLSVAGAVCALILCAALIYVFMPRPAAEIEITPSAAAAYWQEQDVFNGEKGWFIKFTIKNVSDVPFTPTYAQAKWYVGDKLNGSSPAIDYEFMRNWMESETLVKGETPLDLYCGTDRLNADRGVFIISGTDANGHELKFSISIDLIHEFPPESEN